MAAILATSPLFIAYSGLDRERGGWNSLFYFNTSCSYAERFPRAANLLIVSCVFLRTSIQRP